MTDERLELEQLRQARIGSHSAFRALVEPYQAELQRHCYRMTGSLDDADDLVQETLFRAWRALGSYVSRGSFRAWLYRIATNRTLDLIKSTPYRSEIVNSAGEPAWLQPYPPPYGIDETVEAAERLETIGLAFVVALQRLPGRQRSALLLCDVLGFTPAEAAESLGCSVAAANSMLQRARARMADVRPVTHAAPSNHEQKQLADRFVEAWRHADTDAMMRLLDDAVHITMPPQALEWAGRIAVVEMLMDIAPSGDPTLLRFVPTEANAEHGFATYVRAPGSERFDRHCIMLFGTATPAAAKITGFTEDRIFDLLDLPAAVGRDSPPLTPRR
ncbi:MAG: RNA polymerase subunit sigma-70 [Gaiellaceae bacterium]